MEHLSRHMQDIVVCMGTFVGHINKLSPLVGRHRNRRTRTINEV